MRSIKDSDLDVHIELLKDKMNEIKANSNMVIRLSGICSVRDSDKEDR